MTLLKMENICKIYHSGTSMQVNALYDVSLTVSTGEMLAVVGKSGSGKSTLAHIMGTLDKPTSGIYYYRDEQVLFENDRSAAELRNKKIGFVLQDFGLILHKSVEDNLMVPLIFNNAISIKKMKQKVNDVLEKLDMIDMRYRLAGELSGGQKQRIAIARAVINDPELLIADEPTGSLDSTNGEMIMELFQTLKNEGKTIVMVTHDLEMANRCDRKIELMDGKIKMMQ